MKKDRRRHSHIGPRKTMATPRPRIGLPSEEMTDNTLEHMTRQTNRGQNEWNTTGHPATLGIAENNLTQTQDNLRKTSNARTLNNLDNHMNMTRNMNLMLFKQLAQTLIEYSTALLMNGRVNPTDFGGTGVPIITDMETKTPTEHEDLRLDFDIDSPRLQQSILSYFRKELAEDNPQRLRNMTLNGVTMFETSRNINYKETTEHLPWHSPSASLQSNYTAGSRYLEKFLITAKNLQRLNDSNKPLSNEVMYQLQNPKTGVVARTQKRLQGLRQDIYRSNLNKTRTENILTTDRAIDVVRLMHTHHVHQMFKASLDTAIRTHQPDRTVKRLQRRIIDLKRTINVTETETNTRMLRHIRKRHSKTETNALERILQDFEARPTQETTPPTEGPTPTLQEEVTARRATTQVTATSGTPRQEPSPQPRGKRLTLALSQSDTQQTTPTPGPRLTPALSWSDTQQTIPPFTITDMPDLQTILAELNMQF